MNISAEIQGLNQSDLQPRAKALYLALMELAGKETKCKAILASLVYKSGMSESSVIRATKELETAGFISVVRSRKKGPGTLPNIYNLLKRAAQSSQIESTSPVSLTDKNLNKTEEIANPLPTNTACHHDTRGSAPGVMDDRLQEYRKIHDIVKTYEDPPDQEAVFAAMDVVALIGLQGLETELRKRRTGQSMRKVQYDLEDIVWEQRNASRMGEEVA